MKVTFHGVRGSTPCDGPQLARYGGNTSCVAVEVEGQAPIVFDLGTGLRNFGLSLLEATPFDDLDFHGTVLLSHLHWDHVQGLPFFVPLHRPGNTFDVYGPQQAEGPLGEVFTGMMQPPYFPITPEQLEGEVRFHDVGNDDFPLSTTAKVRSRWIRHVGPTLGYRLEWQGVSIAYLSDHGQGCARHHEQGRRSRDDRDRRLRPRRRPRSLRRRRPADPRRAAHAGRVREQAPLGSLHGRLRGARREGSRRPAPGAVPPRPRAQRRPDRRAGPRRQRTPPRTSAPARCWRLRRAWSLELAPQHAGGLH